MLTIISFTASCSKDVKPDRGTANLYITDAAVDNPDVQGVFVTIADIQINGKSIEGFSKQTINLMAYQNGQTKLLSSGQIDAGAYNNVELFLDQDADADGNAPGCYVMTSNGKENLASSSVGSRMINITGSFSVVANTSNDLVLDFNLRKAIKTGSMQSTNYSFVAQGGLNNSVRIVNKDMSGSITGTYSGAIGSDQEVIAYLYKKGEYNAESETAANSDGILFANAENSDMVEGAVNGTYKLSFLEEGNYELHFAEFKRNSDGTIAFQNMLDIDTSGNISANDIQVTAGADVSLSIILKGIL